MNSTVSVFKFVQIAPACCVPTSFFCCYPHALQRQNAENLKQIFPEKEYRGLSPNFHIHVSVSELCIPTMGLPVLLEEICRLILGNWGALFPEKVYINGIAVAVRA
jgi:hypothetical protein